jgi:hypothetical protein
MSCSCGNDTSTQCSDNIDGDGSCIYNSEQFPLPAVVGGSVGGFLALLALLILAIFIWKRKFSLDISSLPEEIRWYFDENRISKEIGWNHEFGEGFLVKDLTEEKKYVNRLKGLLNNHLDGTKIEYDRVYAIYNKTLLSNFIGSRKVIGVRHTNSAPIFKKNDWERDPDGLREFFKEKYDALANSFSWNSPKDLVPIIPVVHGTDAKVGKQICSGGFAALSSLDAGYYGKGIYFTSSCLYATPYFATKSEPSILICFIIPGNIRPIIEHRGAVKSFLGVPIDSGYQSHYVLTNRDGNPLTKKTDRYYDEIVLSNEVQVVPVFLLYVSRDILGKLAKEFAREIPGNEEKPVKGSRRATKKTRPTSDPLKDSSSSLIDDTRQILDDTRQIAD